MDYTYILVALALILGGLVGYFARQIIANQQIRNARKEAQKLLEDATTKYNELLVAAREEASRVSRVAEAESRERRLELQRAEKRFSQKEETLERKLDSTERRERNLESKEKDIERTRTEIEGIKQKQLAQLEFLAGIPQDQAKNLLLQAIRQEVEEEASRQVRNWQAGIKEEADKEAQRILATAIQRCTTDVVSQTTVSTISLPSDEMKGRLIGREGRNIRALEQATGVDLIIDDTPETVTISSFDPVRREVARLALNKLILDGRIHPARIEEIVEKTKTEVEAIMRSEGERAAYEAGVPGLHPELIKLLGRLKFRVSYGQNILLHSLEISHLARMLASEIGADASIARKAGLLHDIGKAVDYEVEGPHALIGANLVRQWDKSEVVAQAIAEHHGEAETTSVMGFIVAAADAISGSRPGARRESAEHYLKRVKDLEDIAASLPGVEKAFAIQAGREVRIMVKPDQVDDLGSVRLARDISKKIEETLSYPGQIKVVVVRETTAIDYAK
ncbi:MAG: ribonuclease Y [Dehalococcoidia bacterium CG2_30_46_9]|nr:MAG: ribonuclease Y [Dehalococcoidia bacterium CG2_30_46_9]PIX27058.1 MAG: ribonuclease Y [Chloroflexi bacterium CG_4_8_14_3_um_filter_45_15]